jgi:hypothetical protein
MVGEGENSYATNLLFPGDRQLLSIFRYQQVNLPGKSKSPWNLVMSSEADYALCLFRRDANKYAQV